MGRLGTPRARRVVAPSPEDWGASNLTPAHGAPLARTVCACVGMRHGRCRRCDLACLKLIRACTFRWWCLREHKV
eukprot:3799055-Prymnesium_polylepis.2